MLKRAYIPGALPARKKRRAIKERQNRLPADDLPSPLIHSDDEVSASDVESADPSLQVSDADRPASIKVEIRSVRNQIIEEVLQKATEKGIDIPDQNMYCGKDPRLFRDIFAFKDFIRRMYNCQRIGIDITTLRLKHGSDEGAVDMNILNKSWDGVLEIFNDKNNGNYVVYVAFEPVDDPEVSIYESPEPPSEARTFFDTRNAEVQLDGPLNEIGEEPKPKAFRYRDDQRRYYSGYDVDTEHGRREWQRRLLANLSCNATAARLKLEKLPESLTSAQKMSITTAQERMHKEAIEEEGHANTKRNAATDAKYCNLQRAFSGTEYRSGPPVDICVRLLMATKTETGLYRSELLEGFVKCHFYHYQISGAIGLILKLYGQIDAEVLLRKTNRMEHALANDVREAAASLKDICINGAMLADETGFGKTKQALLAAVLHTFFYTERDKSGNECHRPVLLVIPPTLIRQWLVEILNYWPYLIPILSYEDPAFGN
ncbi:hypothetical protein BJX61DRAFT_538909 [Aspergillus egyptiacus]|nr:hypothetical protein BJX61DRAFT_538909 [Aspergillus egyptiacus]